MKKILALCALSLSALVFNSSAQNGNVAESDMRAAFETWKSTREPNGDAQPAFIVAEAERLNEISARVTTGIATWGKGFTLVVKPLKIETDANGKVVQTNFAEAAKITSPPSGDVETFTDPRITFKVPSKRTPSRSAFNSIKMSLRLS